MLTYLCNRASIKRKPMKSIVVLFIIIFIAACSSMERSNKVPDRFKKFMDQYFYGYAYEYKDNSVRGNKNYGEQSALFTIKKNDLSQDEMGEIYNKLVEGGWRVIDTNYKNYTGFCYGEDFIIDVLFPLKKYEETASGSPINYTDINSWNIFIYKSTTKIAECNQDQNDFIDFTKL